LLLDLDGVALFDEGVNSILENDAPLSLTNIPTGTTSIVTHNLNHHAKGTTSDVGISIRDSVRYQQSLQLDIDGLGLLGEGKGKGREIRFYKTTCCHLSNQHPEWWYSIFCDPYS
jgi:hypothetical protein